MHVLQYMHEVLMLATVKKNIVVVDGLNLFIQNFVGSPAIVRDGQPGGGIVGFLNLLGSICRSITPSEIIIVWEGGGSIRKRGIFSEYKQKRRPEKLNRYYPQDEVPNTVDNRNWQLSSLIKVLEQLPIYQVYVENCEADDVVSYIAKKKVREDSEVNCTIVSSDKDFYQLINEKINVFNPVKKRSISYNDVIDRYSITPSNFALAKAMCGDDSDNVPGVKSLGFKTVAKLFPALNSNTVLTLDEILKSAEAQLNNDKKKLKALQNITESKALIKRNLKLMTLDDSILSHNQIRVINGTFDVNSPKLNKMGFYSELHKIGAQTFNFDQLLIGMQNIQTK